jgi:two-component system, NtrC family, sensor kinase
MNIFEKLKYISISTRISLLIGIIILIAMGLFSTFSLIEQKKDAISTISNNTEQLSQTIEKILRFSMMKNRRDEISLAINSITGTEEIKSARILNHEGVIIYTSNKSELNKDISRNNPLCSSCHEGKKHEPETADIKNFNHYRINEQKEMIDYSLPIFNEPGCSNEACHAVNDSEINAPTKEPGKDTQAMPVHNPSQAILGFIEIEVSIENVISNLKETRLQLILLTLIFAIMASVIAYFSIRHIVGKPVRNLVEGTQRVAQGDFKHAIPPGKAELGTLAESFNKMQSQLLRTQTQLIESEKLASVGKLANEIANEINNPLTGIIIYSESLLNNSDKDEFKDDYEIIRQEALKIRESIRNILSLTREDKPDFKLIDIGPVIMQAVSVVKKFSNFRNIKIITGIQEDLPEIPADAALLEQVFLNLLLISSETMLTGGILDISASLNEEKNEIDVNFHDTGKGIPEDTLRNIADEESSPKNFEKTGISLIVCKEIIRMHRGKLKIDSNESGNTIKIVFMV